MARNTSVGMGYRHSEMNRSLSSTGVSHIVTRLASRSLTVDTQVHQHCGLEFHIVLTDDSCIRRGCWSGATARRICTQLERSTFEGYIRVSSTRDACCLCRTRSSRVLGPTQYLIGLTHPVTASRIGLLRRSSP
jgi:hypothetical protein